MLNKTLMISLQATWAGTKFMWLLEQALLSEDCCCDLNNGYIKLMPCCHEQRVLLITLRHLHLPQRQDFRLNYCVVPSRHAQCSCVDRDALVGRYTKSMLRGCTVSLISPLQLAHQWHTLVNGKPKLECVWQYSTTPHRQAARYRSWLLA